MARLDNRANDGPFFCSLLHTRATLNIPTCKVDVSLRGYEEAFEMNALEGAGEYYCWGAQVFSAGRFGN